MYCILSSDLDLLLHPLGVLAELCIVLGEQVHLQLQLVDVSLQFLLQLQAFCSAFHLYIQTGLHRLQRSLVTFSNRGMNECTKELLQRQTVGVSLQRQ